MSNSTGETSTTETGEIMLFGVRLTIDSMRKTVSLNNLSQYVHPQDPLIILSVGDKDVSAGYASADEVVAVQHRCPSSSANADNRERKRGVPWTEEEHKMFLLGLQKVGKGDWRGISRNFVKTRTPTQVASHAQKHFLRRNSNNRRRRRSSLFDITTEMVSATPTEDQLANKYDTNSHSPRTKLPQEISSEISMVRFSAPPTHLVASPPQVDQIMSENVPVIKDYMKWNTANTHRQINLMTNLPVSPIATTDKSMVELDLNKNSMMTDSSSLSLNLSLSLLSNGSNIPRQSSFHAMPSFFNGDSMISAVG